MEFQKVSEGIQVVLVKVIKLLASKTRQKDTNKAYSFTILTQAASFPLWLLGVPHGRFSLKAFLWTENL